MSLNSLLIREGMTALINGAYHVLKEIPIEAKKYYVANSAKVIAWQKNYYERNKPTHINGVLRRLYNITLKDYENILAAQNMKCAICGTTESSGVSTKLHVDHCHKTKSVRGLLCTSCNNGLGKFKDNSELLTSAAAYLRKFY